METKGSRGAGRTHVHGPGHEFLAGAAFAVNQNRALGGGHGANGLLQFFHGGTDADDVVERVAGGGIAFEGEVLAAERHFLESAVDGQLDFVDQSGRLADVVGGAAGFHGFDGGFVVVHRGDQDDGGVGRNLVGVAQHFDAIGVRHLDVGDDDVVEGAVELSFGHFAGVDGLDLVTVAAQGDVQHFADGALVVANQNVTHARLLPPLRQ